MEINRKQSPEYTCRHCKNTSDVIGVVQTEVNYYSLNLETNQLDDFHGDGTVELQKFFCLACKIKINVKNIERGRYKLT